MTALIEDYALIGDCETAALVARNGSIDWACFPRFDSSACFAALLGTPEHGRWLLAPTDTTATVRRHYRAGTLVLETEYTTASGTVAILDCMPPRSEAPDIIRMVEGRQGTVAMHMELIIRFGYGAVVPWVRKTHDGLWALAGPDSLYLHTPVPLHGENFHTCADFTVAAGERVPFTLTWHPSHKPPPRTIDPVASLRDTEQWWREWSDRCTYTGPWMADVKRSLITLKALTYAPTGGIVAAATTSLPEQLGGVRNWDYRYCWVRDATFTLYALMTGGYMDEARAWREWLVRAVAGKPAEMQIMYGLAGERRLQEYTLDWLPGYAGSTPVRVGNAAYDQHQLDIYGEVMDAFHVARQAGLEPNENAWRVQQALLDFLESHWDRPDEGIWEVRGPRRHFTHSKAMAWVAVDRGIKALESMRLEGPLERWRSLRTTIHAQVCREGFNPTMNAFVQSYGSDQLDASLLMLPLVGFLPAHDPRMRGTVAAIQQHLVNEGFVYRYRTASQVDGLPAGEGTFLVCSFWLADNLALQGRVAEARTLFERLLNVRNDVGLLAEEYDPVSKRLLGNFPQAFSHVGLINTARNLSAAGSPPPGRAATPIPAPGQLPARSPGGRAPAPAPGHHRGGARPPGPGAADAGRRTEQRGAGNARADGSRPVKHPRRGRPHPVAHGHSTGQSPDPDRHREQHPAPAPDQPPGVATQRHTDRAGAAPAHGHPDATSTVAAHRGTVDGGTADRRPSAHGRTADGRATAHPRTSTHGRTTADGRTAAHPRTSTHGGLPTVALPTVAAPTVAPPTIARPTVAVPIGLPLPGPKRAKVRDR